MTRFTQLILWSWLAGALATFPVLAADTSSAEQLGIASQSSASSTADPSAGDETFKSTLGQGETQATGGSGETRGYTASASYSGETATVLCDGRVRFLGGIGVRTPDCQYNAAGVLQSVEAQICTASRDGSACSEDKWSGAQTLAAGGSSTFGTFTVSLDCQQTPCRIGLAETDSYAGSADSLQTDAGLKLAGTDEGSLYAGTRDTYSDGNYRLSLASTGSQYGGCLEQVQDGINSDGKIYTCDGQQSASFDSATCETTTECIEWATVENSYSEACEADIGLANNACESVTPLIGCQISRVQYPRACTRKRDVIVTQPPDAVRTVELVASCVHRHDGCTIEFDIDRAVSRTYSWPTSTTGGTRTASEPAYGIAVTQSTYSYPGWFGAETNYAYGDVALSSSGAEAYSGLGSLVSVQIISHAKWPTSVGGHYDQYAYAIDQYPTATNQHFKVRLWNTESKGPYLKLQRMKATVRYIYHPAPVITDNGYAAATCVDGG